MEVLGGPGPRHFLKNEQINVSTVERRTLKTAPRTLQYGEDAFFTRNTEVRNGPCRGDDRRRTLPYGSHDYIYLLNKDMIVAVVIAIYEIAINEKEIGTSTGFEPMASALALQCSTN